MSPPRLLEYLKAQRALGISARTLVNHAVSLRHMFEALAPDQDWTWMLLVIRRLKTTVVWTKNHSDLPSIGELSILGVRLTRLAQSATRGSKKQRAIMFRNGLMIAMLAARPVMRRENLARIKIDQNLIRSGETYFLRFTKDEMKGGRGRDAPLPPFLADAVDHYLEAHRPVLLLGRPEIDRTLFISKDARPIYPHAMSHEIGDVTEAAFGRRINPHDFRRSAGSSIAREDPKHVGIVPSILGHADYRTSEEYYIFANESSAYARVDEALTRYMTAEVADDETDVGASPG